MSKILIQYETFDADQFQRLLAGEAPEDVFADQEPEESRHARRRGSPARSPAAPRGIGLPLPGNIASGQPPESPQPS